MTRISNAEYGLPDWLWRSETVQFQRDLASQGVEQIILQTEFQHLFERRKWREMTCSRVGIHSFHIFKYLRGIREQRGARYHGLRRNKIKATQRPRIRQPGCGVVARRVEAQLGLTDSLRTHCFVFPY